MPAENIRAVNPAVPPASSAMIDAVRGFAAIWVACFHAYIWIIAPTASNAFHAGFGTWFAGESVLGMVEHVLLGYGFLGVNIFFVVSGFCIHAPNARKKATNIDLKRFFLRRLIRIYPLYITVVLILFFLYGPMLAQWQAKGVNLSNFIGHAFFWHYWGAPEASGMGISGVMWTLALEIQFYALYALLFPLILRFGLGRSTMLLLAMELLYRAAIHAGWINPEESHQVFGAARFSPMRFGEWLLGAWLAERWVAGRLGGRFCWQLGVFAAVIGGLAVVMGVCIVVGGACWGLNKYDATDVPGALVAGAVLAVLLGVEQQRHLGVPQWMRWFGDRCFSIYLTHATILLILSKLVAKFSGLTGWSDDATRGVLAFGGLATCIVVGDLAYRVIERPSHNWAKAIR